MRLISHSLQDLRLNLQKGILANNCKPGQKSIAEEVIGPKEELTIAFSKLCIIEMHYMHIRNV